ncbi:thioesterase [Elizabethkingia argentiflava]|uniref:Thioesterase n=1 Tax=Elizabethkingia argenteiflava TaxID=2681556 RepID=A0A845PUZ1_9FLAO|nr:acyl-CoA thioesterase [Elizabethkingia argenteiflava]NAW51644.1 thioesterase [Elizabethkingia argenteiflava]
MSAYYHKFEVRWSDIDANRHLANSSYVMFCAQTRMAFMKAHGIGISQLIHWGVGPVVLREEYSFFKEIMADQTVYVGLEVSGMSEDGSIYSFTHKFYLPDGTHCATAKVVGVWIDTIVRKLTTPPDDLLVCFQKYKTDNIEIIKREDLKKISPLPENVDPNLFK